MPFYPQNNNQFQQQQPQFNNNNFNNNRASGFSASATEFVPGGRPQQQQQQDAPRAPDGSFSCTNCGRSGHLAKFCRFPANNNNNASGTSSFNQQQTPQAQTQPQLPAEPEKKTVSAADALQKKSADITLNKNPGAKAKSISLSFGKKKTEDQPATPTTPAVVEEAKESSKGITEGANTTTTTVADDNTNDTTDAPEKKASSPTTASPTTTTTTAASKPGGKSKAAKINRLRSKTYVRDPRPHFSVVFCGHVDSGKSTCSGHMLADFGLVEEREMEKLRREAEANHREGWEYAYVMDLSEEERAKGKTHETGAAYLETDKRRITVLDAPGHNAFVGSMIGGAAQADIAVMIVSAKTGEFESGFNKGGQTREHVVLCRSCGVRHMIIGINKMDDCNWDKERYDQILKDILPYFKQNGYVVGNNATVVPLSGLSGNGLTKRIPKEMCEWYNEGPSLIDVINGLDLPASKGEDDELCIPLICGYKDENGKTFINGKIEAGSVVIGDELMLLPGNKVFTVEGIQVENTELEKAYPNDNVHIRVKGLDENDVHIGNVVTNVDSKLRAVEYIQARVVILDARNLISNGSKAVLHVHTAAEEVTFHSLLAKLEMKTFEPTEKNPTFVKPGEAVLARIELGIPIVMAEAKDFDKLGRFVLRDQSKTIAIGLVTKLYESTKSNMKTKSGAAATSS